MTEEPLRKVKRNTSSPMSTWRSAVEQEGGEERGSTCRLRGNLSELGPLYPKWRRKWGKRTVLISERPGLGGEGQKTVRGLIAKKILSFRLVFPQTRGEQQNGEGGKGRGGRKVWSQSASAWPHVGPKISRTGKLMTFGRA